MAIKLITDSKRLRKTAEKAIKIYGSGPEHNFHHYRNLQEHGKKNIFVSFGDDDGNCMGILAQRDDKNVWYTVDEVLAPQELRMPLFIEFISFVFDSQKAKKLITESEHGFRLRLMKAEKNKFRFPKIMYSLFWPIIDLSEWDSSLQGGNWKKLRNLQHRLTKNHVVKTVDTLSIPKKQLTQLLDIWIKKRSFRDKVERERYINLIDGGFKGCDYARSIIVDGKVSTISAGWKIPNSNYAYSAIGILNYEFEGLGEYAYIDELNFLKSKGFEKANFGGSDEPMLQFKNKFKPVSQYQTDVYSILKS